MSTATVEVVPVEDLELLLGETPPCQATHGEPVVPCGNPAAARVRVWCSCGSVFTGFLCRPCLTGLQLGQAQCRPGCGQNLTLWTEI
jgi:hypothetical protein